MNLPCKCQNKTNLQTHPQGFSKKQYKAGWVCVNTPQSGGIRNFAGGKFFLGGGNLRRSDFDNSNIFQS